MNFKKILSIASAAAIALSSSAAYAKTMEFTIGSTSLYISDNGISQAVIETAPYTENGRTMVPVRIISENFGAEVSWNEQTSEVTVEDGSNKIVLTLGSNSAVVNGSEVALDAPAKEIGGRTMVPLRFISENLGKNVSYTEATKQVLISDEKPILSINEKIYTVDDFRFIIGDVEGISDADLAMYISQAISFFTEVGSVATAAEKDNFIISSEQLQTIKDTLNENADKIYPYSLMAPIANYNTDLAKSQAYLTINSNINLGEPDFDSIYTSEYVKAKHILILTQDPDTGEAYSEEKKAESKKLADDILAKLKKGENFDELCAKHTQDPGYEYQPDGYVFTKGEMVKEFEDTAFSLKDNEISGIVETSYGYHILKREPLPELDDETKYHIQNNLLNEEFDKFYSKCMDEAEVQTYMSTDEIIALLR